MQVRSGAQENNYVLDERVLHGLNQRGNFLVILPVHVCSQLDQKRKHFSAFFLKGEVDWSLAHFVGLVDRYPREYQGAYPRELVETHVFVNAALEFVADVLL